MLDILLGIRFEQNSKLSIKPYSTFFRESSRKFTKSNKEYAYNREVRINQENVQDLLPAADQFNIEGNFHKYFPRI